MANGPQVPYSEFSIKKQTQFVSIDLGSNLEARPMTGIFVPEGYHEPFQVDIVLWLMGNHKSGDKRVVDARVALRLLLRWLPFAGERLHTYTNLNTLWVVKMLSAVFFAPQGIFMIVCLSPNGRNTSSAAGPAATVLIGTLRGVYAMTRGNEPGSWQTELLGIADKHISSLLYEPVSKLLFAGIHGRGDAGGLFVSPDLGRTWEPRMTGLDRTHVYTIAAEQRGEETILYVGTEPPALYRSTDLGATWTDLAALRDVPGTEKWIFPPPPHIAHVKGLTLQPGMPGVLYALVEQGAVLKSADDGASWQEIHSYSSADDSFYRDVHRLVLGAKDPRRMHLATGDGLYFSDDAGVTWEHQQKRSDRVGYPDALFLDPSDDATVYMGGAGDAPETWRTEGGAFPGFIVSRDSGKHWTELMNGIPQPVHGNIEAIAMHSSPASLEFFAGTAVGDIFATENGGADWRRVATGLPPVSKARHYRHFLSAEEKVKIEGEAQAERRAEGLADRVYHSNT